MVMQGAAFRREWIQPVPPARAALLPLVRHADEMRPAAGLAAALINAVRAEEPIADFLLHGLLRWLAEAAAPAAAALREPRAAARRSGARARRWR